MFFPKWTAEVALAMAVGTAASVARAAEGDAAFHLDLYNAVFATETQADVGPTLQMDVEKKDGVWQRVWPDAPYLNKGVHRAIVTEGSAGADKITLKLSAAIGGDAWVKGGRGRYSVALTRKSDGTLQGTWEGSFRDKPAKGVARGWMLPEAKNVKPGYKPVEVDEHPRLLFRKQDVAALREKAKTDFGAAAIGEMKGIIGGAVKYQLLGEKKYADEIMPLVEAEMKETHAGDKMIRGRVLGWRFEQIAIAYDCCFDAWPADFRKKVSAYLTSYQAWRPFKSQATFQKEIQWLPAALYPPAIRYGPALGAIAVWGEKGPEPVKPSEKTFMYEDPTPAVKPVAASPKAGAPVVKFASNAPLKDWLVAGPFKALPGKGTQEGYEAARDLQPAAGEKFKFGELEQEFRKLEKYYNASIPVTDAVKRDMNSSGIFTCTLENDAPRYVRVTTDGGQPRIFIAGVEFRTGDVLRLEKGTYPLVIVAYTGQQSQWGNDLIAPKLTEMTDEQAREWVANMKSEADDRALEYQADVAIWKASGGMNVDTQKFFEVARHNMNLFFSEGIGSGGFKGSSMSSLEGPPKYAAAYRNAFCVDSSPYDDIGAYLPRKLFTQVYGAGGQGHGQEMDQSRDFKVKQYIEQEYDIAPILFGTMYPLVDEKYKPGVLWAWQRHMDVTGDKDAAKVLKEQSRPLTGYLHEAFVSWTFVNYPLGAKPKPLGEVLPLTWRADDFGWCGFRNGYKGANDFVTQVYAKAHSNDGENAGAFRIMGLGQTWGVGGVLRPFENVVQLPEDQINAGGRGKVAGYSAGPDGSGVVTIDYTDVYSSSKSKVFEPFGKARREAAFVPSGITGGRSVAVDYSGKSGAPCVIALADVVHGGGLKTWSWPSRFQLAAFGAKLDAAAEKREYASFTQAEMKEMWDKYGSALAAGKAAASKKDDKKKKEEEEDPDAAVAVDDVTPVVNGRTFTITKGDAVLTATLIAPSDGKFELTSAERFHMGAKYTVARFFSTGVQVNTKAKDATFVVVVTIGKGAAPAVSGDASTVKVGGQTLRFDGSRWVQ